MSYRNESNKSASLISKLQKKTIFGKGISKFHPVTIFVILIGLLISGSQVVNWYQRDNENYKPPLFEKLSFVQGTIGFTTRWKSSGGEMLIKDNGREIAIVSCTSPYSIVTSCADSFDNQGKMLAQLTGGYAKVWYSRDEDLNELGGKAYKQVIKGRLYQLQVKDQITINYEDTKHKYLKQLNRSHDELFFAFLFFIILVIFPLFKGLKEK